MGWTPGWEAPYGESAGVVAEVDAAEADRLFSEASDKLSLLRAQEAYERQLALRPDDYDVLVRLSEIHILRGAGYSENRREKAESYTSGIQLAEQAMATQAEFRRRVEGGATIGEAIEVLDREEMKAMLLWVTGVSYYFKECLNGLGHIVNFSWMKRTQDVMEHMMEVDPDFEFGAVRFSLGIFFLGLPESVGGDLARAEELIDQAVDRSGDHFLARWGRAKYLAVKTGDRKAFEADLLWILEQDPDQASSPYPWNVYMQRDAKEMLAQVDRLFPG